jgi:aminopeptidase YwaD
MPHPLIRSALALAMLAVSCAPAAAAPSPATSQTSPPTAEVAVAAPTTAAPPAVAAPVTPSLAAEAAPAATTAPPPTAPVVVQSPAAPAEFSGDLAKRHVDALAADIGSRPAGSANQARAGQYVLDQLRQLGYQAELQPFQVSQYDDRGSSLSVAGPLGRSILANTLQHSPAGVVEGELVEAGLGRPGDFSPSAVRGKIALIERGDIRFSQKVENVAQAGAVGAVIYNNEPRNFSGSLAATASIPAVSASQEDGESLLAQLRRGPVTVRLEVDATLEPRTANNVIGVRPGGPETIVIGAHLDSVSAGPGANDNGSGTAVMLELARVLAARPSPFTIKFVAFDAEEIGLLGSGHLVSQLTEAERRSIRAMINLDMVGVGEQPRFGGSEELTRPAFAVAASLGQPAQSIGDGLNGASDHASFLRAGIPALFLYRSNDPNYHSPNDLAEYVDPANLDFAGRVVLGVLDSVQPGRAQG